MSVAVLVVHLGGIWSDRVIGKAACFLPFANIIVPIACVLALVWCWGMRHYAWTVNGILLSVRRRRLTVW